MTTTPSWTAGPDATTIFARLSGDYNPIHLEPEAAQASGFDTIVVHGMCVLGVIAQAARAQVHDMALRRIDARFAAPVFPGQPLDLEATVDERPDGTMRVDMVPAVAGNAVVKPARFTFAADGLEWAPPFEISDADDDVVGEVFTLTDDDVSDYRTLVTPQTVALDGVPPMAALLGMTDALAKAFGNREPPRPGAWVHLRQQGDFHQEIRANTPYRCRIYEGRAVVRKSNVGFQVVIRFVVEKEQDRSPVATGTVTLMYLFDKEPT